MSSLFYLWLEYDGGDAMDVSRIENCQSMAEAIIMVEHEDPDDEYNCLMPMTGDMDPTAIHIIEVVKQVDIPPAELMATKMAVRQKKTFVDLEAKEKAELERLKAKYERK